MKHQNVLHSMMKPKQLTASFPQVEKALYANVMLQKGVVINN